MNEEEKRSIKFTKEYLEEEKNLRDDYKWKSGFYANGDIERLLNLIEKQQKEIENYQILKDDIEGHRIAYVDTPEFEEKYISIDKIKEKIKELESHIWKDGYMTKFDRYAIHYLNELLGE